MLDLEDAWIARVAQRRFSVKSSALSRLLGAQRAGKLELVRELHEAGLISTEQALELADVRGTMRPGGLKLVSLIGDGATARVFRARSEHGLDLAVKILKSRETRTLRQLNREIAALSRISHPSIPRLVHEGDYFRGSPFLVLEYVGGETLGDRIGRPAAIPASLAIEVATALARALHHVHERGIVHRDVKPCNVILARSGPKLIDFGLACPIGFRSGGFAVGTAGFLSPELARGERATPASDIYSLGATLYFTLAGRVAHEGSTWKEQARDAADPRRRARPLSELRAGLSAPLEAVVERCLRKEPRERFPSMAAVLKELGAALEKKSARLPGRAAC